MRIIKYFFFIIFLSFVKSQLFGQDLADIKVEPRSVEFEQYTLQLSIKNIKTLVFITSLNPYNGKRLDTMRFERYDRGGHKTKSYLFSSGKRTEDVSFQTLNNTITQWESIDLSDKNKHFISRTIKDISGKDLAYHNRGLLKGDTISREDAVFTYNQMGQLVKREDFRAGKVVLRKTFEYKGPDMVLATIRSNFDPQDFHQEIQFIYNANHQPLEKRKSLIRYGKPDPAEITYYTYQGKNLVEERYPDYSIAGKYIQVKYSYDEQNRISEVMATQDTLYRRIAYQYDKNRLLKINAETNYWLKFTKELHIPDLSSRTPMPAKFEREYSYDDHGHIEKIAEKINGDLTTQRIYAIEYYK